MSPTLVLGCPRKRKRAGAWAASSCRAFRPATLGCGRAADRPWAAPRSAPARTPPGPRKWRTPTTRQRAWSRSRRARDRRCAMPFSRQRMSSMWVRKRAVGPSAQRLAAGSGCQSVGRTSSGSLDCAALRDGSPPSWWRCRESPGPCASSRSRTKTSPSRPRVKQIAAATHHGTCREETAGLACASSYCKWNACRSQ